VYIFVYKGDGEGNCLRKAERRKRLKRRSQRHHSAGTGSLQTLIAGSLFSLGIKWWQLDREHLPDRPVALFFSKISNNSVNRLSKPQNLYTFNLATNATRIRTGTRNNLAHCFCCKKNLNNIDLLLTLDYDFRDAVVLLERWLNQYEAQERKRKLLPSSPKT